MQLSILVALITVLAWPFTQAQAQQEPTSFTVTLQVLAFACSPENVALGTVSASSFTNSPPTINCTNNGNQAANFNIAGTHTQQVSPFVNPSWFLSNVSQASNQFMWGFSTASPPVLSFLLGPGSPPGTAFPTTGGAQTLAMAVSPTATVVTNWQFRAPTGTSNQGQQQFNIVVAVF